MHQFTGAADVDVVVVAGAIGFLTLECGTSFTTVVRIPHVVEVVLGRGFLTLLWTAAVVFLRRARDERTTFTIRLELFLIPLRLTRVCAAAAVFLRCARAATKRKHATSENSSSSSSNNNTAGTTRASLRSLMSALKLEEYTLL